MQVVTGDRGENVKLRTALENVEVLSVPPADPNGGRSAAPAITLLATPEAADHLALADSAARVRLLLRNPVDESREAQPGLNRASIFEDWDAPPTGIPGKRTRPLLHRWRRPPLTTTLESILDECGC